jgi:hypothetical protein
MAFDTQQAGKFLIMAGVAMALTGMLLMILGRIGLFKLPGDFVFGGRNWNIYFPLATSIIISLILTLIIWLINYFRK